MLVYDDYVEALEVAVKKINQAAAEAAQAELLTYTCEEVADRISLYLNLQPNEDGIFEFDERLVSIGARIVSGVFTQSKTNIAGTSVDSQITSVSDNGQSISFGDATRNYLATVADGELFGGCVELLKPYRNFNVVSR